MNINIDNIFSLKNTVKFNVPSDTFNFVTFIEESKSVVTTNYLGK